MAVLEIQSNGDSSYVSQEAINSAIQSLEDPLQRVSPISCKHITLGVKSEALAWFGSLRHLRVCRSLSRSVWRWIPVSDPLLGSSCSIKRCSRCPYWSCWLPTASSATSVSAHAHTHTQTHPWTMSAANSAGELSTVVLLFWREKKKRCALSAVCFNVSRQIWFQKTLWKKWPRTWTWTWWLLRPKTECRWSKSCSSSELCSPNSWKSSDFRHLPLFLCFFKALTISRPWAGQVLGRCEVRKRKRAKTTRTNLPALVPKLRLSFLISDVPGTGSTLWRRLGYNAHNNLSRRRWSRP